MCGPAAAQGLPAELLSARPPLDQTLLPGPVAVDMTWFLCLCVLFAVALALLLLQLNLGVLAHGPREPPRLPALPLIGSLLSLRSPHAPHVLFKDLQGKYGPTYSLMMGSHRVIVVNQHVHAKQVLLRKGKIFAGRPRTVGTLLLLLLPVLPVLLNLGLLLFFSTPSLSSSSTSSPFSSLFMCLLSTCDEGYHRRSDQRWERHRVWRLQCHMEVPQEDRPWSSVHVWRGLLVH